MKKTELEGFPFQFGKDLVQKLNEVYNDSSLNNSKLEQIGRAVSSEARHEIHGDTSDGYGWFGRLYFHIGGTTVAILFPWTQDLDHPESKMDRSINVYSNGTIPLSQVEGLVEDIVHELYLSGPSGEFF